MEQTTISPSRLLRDLADDDLITADVAAPAVKSTPGTLAIWRSTKRYPLPYVRLGRRVYYRVSDIRRFIESRFQSGTSESLSPHRKRRA
jgi:hypothetical protein